MKSTFKLALFSTVCVTAFALSSGAQAQDAGLQETSSEELPVDDDSIVVTGIRAALQNAEDRKRDSDVVIDGISADDIGALPDVSISESLTRIAGHYIQRYAARLRPGCHSWTGSGPCVYRI